MGAGWLGGLRGVVLCPRAALGSHVLELLLTEILFSGNIECVEFTPDTDQDPHQFVL